MRAFKTEGQAAAMEGTFDPKPSYQRVQFRRVRHSEELLDLEKAVHPTL